jgi:serine/threonine protein kinase/Leucine-rich repeat (LRR) protein
MRSAGSDRILKKLGAGGMGVVFLAEDSILHRQVALKTKLPSHAANKEVRQRFLREARAAASIEHDHIVPIFQVGEDNKVPYLAMPLLQGETLEERLRSAGKLPTLEVIRIGRETAEGLAAAHQRGLVHRDVKPANLWLEKGHGRVKILDFGLVRPQVVSDRTAEESPLTSIGTVLGTPAYMAPEQARGQAVDFRCDLFSLGSVLYRLCTGERPFKGANVMSILLSLAQDTPALPNTVDRQVPAPLSDLVMHLLNKDPARRPASALAVVQRLADLEASLTAPPIAKLASTVPIQPAAQANPWADIDATGPQLVARSARNPTDTAASRDLRRPLTRLSRRFLLTAAAVLLGSVILVAAVIIIRIATDKGELVIKADESVEVTIKRNGQPVEDLELHKGEKVTSVRSGHIEVVLTGANADQFVVKHDRITLQRGDKVVVEIERKVVPAKRKQGDDAWLKAVAAMPPEKQVEAVAAKLKELNPRFDGKVTHKIGNGVVTELHFDAEHVTNLSAVKALRELKVLECSGVDGPSKLSDLRPLEGLKLTMLRCNNTAVAELAPLRDMPIWFLEFYNAKVADLSPLKKMKLEHLGCGGTLVTDLSPLKGIKLGFLACPRISPSAEVIFKDMPLAHIYSDCRGADFLRSIKTLQTINGKPVKEFWKELDDRQSKLDTWIKSVAGLSPEKQVEAVAAKLKEMNPEFDGKVAHKVENGQVTELVVETDKVVDLSPMRALPALHHLGCSGSGPGKGRLPDGQFQVNYWEPVGKGEGVHRFADLSPLKGSKLVALDCSYSRVADLSPLEGMPLLGLVCASSKVSDLKPLKGMPLVVLNCKDTPIADLSPIKDLPVEYLFADFTRISDLSPLKGMKLLGLTFSGTAVADLGPLKGMKLTSLSCWRTKVTDLGPLAGMQLTSLDCASTKVSSLVPLKGMPLKTLNCRETQVSDLSPLKGLPIEQLTCDFKPERDAEILSSIKTLILINDKPVKEFWKEFDLKK